MATIEIGCVEIWRELSNYIDDDIQPALRQRMDGHFKTRKHRVAVLAGTRNIIRLVSDGRAFDMSAGFSERLTARLARKLGGYDLFMRRRVESGWTRAAATRTTSRNEDQSM